MLPLIPWCFIGPREPLATRKLKPTFVLLQFTTRHKSDSGLVAFSSYLWPFLDLYYTFLDCSHGCAVVPGGRAGWWAVVYKCFIPNDSPMSNCVPWHFEPVRCQCIKSGVTCEKKALLLDLERESRTWLESSLRSSCPGRGSLSSSLCVHTRTHACR